MKQILSIIIFLFFMSGCTCDSNRQYTTPQKLNDGFNVVTATSAIIDTVKLYKGINKIACGNYGEIQSILIYKNNALVVEEYFKGHDYKWDASNYHGEIVDWNLHSPHDVMSCAKSFTSALIGIAIDKGFIKDVNQSIFDYLPQHQYLNTNHKKHITIEHLLTMTSGLAWNEWTAHGTSENDIDRIYFECSNDPVKCVLEREFWTVPGESFTYNGGGMIILGEILKNASGLNVEDFANTYLFEPLDIEAPIWFQYQNGAYATDGSLKMTSRDMLKLGVLYLNHGMWKEKQIISKEWVVKSSTVYKNNKNITVPIEDTGKSAYSYTWWLNEFSFKGEPLNMYRANGWGGQSIMVFPDLDMVIVFTGANYNAKSHLFKIVENYILKSL
ncbi:CubicO group peptidase, beta-lactamase class C family [Formosa sp. Hel1_31_208]|uniref:serine hydrolase domain-containing protein n=1 Tax=Formosa sp. Hel1_31_208 TaxID=1798225 RepID=UPI0008792AC5|nr:serine hydrolase [Formosa sp. Hel1_31_208]SDS25571.1 CubicO group peptidase, beta-lactamase class C family [Formosa sp. Hel1_31_208]